MPRIAMRFTALLALITLLSGLAGLPARTMAQDTPGDQGVGQSTLFLPLIAGGSPPGGAVAPADAASPLAVTKTASPSPVASGTEITYFITVINTGGAKVNNVVLTDQINGVGAIGAPPQLVLTSTRGSCAQSNLRVTCSASTIEGGGTWTVTIRGIVTAPNGTTLNNIASVTCTKSAQNFTSTASVPALAQNGGGSPLADLSISKTGRRASFNRLRWPMSSRSTTPGLLTPRTSGWSIPCQPGSASCPPVARAYSSARPPGAR